MNKRVQLGIILLTMCSFLLSGCGAKQEQADAEQKAMELSISQMQAVCELATLECYYHNTARFDSEKQVLFWNTSKKLWIEYSGIVRVGIDISKLDMSVKGNVVTITIPEANVLSCDVDDSSLSADTFYSETKGLGSGSIGAEEQTEAFRAAQEGMRETVQEDTVLLNQARLRAQTLLENYVKNVGDAIGVEYSVRWQVLKEEAVSGESKSVTVQPFQVAQMLRKVTLQ
ncbi:MAG: DUF4230 domain-containing protein, partial [Candidatus Gastranaerophilales bacterium]|nr:DUF4230 domain-containing protein [Candidatus Gastranaerophilales bacterium]